MKPLLLIDLDRTIFDTNSFFEFVIEAFTSEFAVSKQEVDKHLHLLAVGATNHLRHTDFAQLLTELHINSERFYAYIAQATSPNQFILADAVPFLEWAHRQDEFELGILSFGQPEIQTLKIEISPLVSSLHRMIIMTRKNDYIVDAFADRQGILVDDKPDQNLPVGWVEIHIDRKANTYKTPVQISERIWQITKLDDAPPTIVKSVSSHK
jgi:hypothetical protein